MTTLFSNDAFVSTILLSVIVFIVLRPRSEQVLQATHIHISEIHSSAFSCTKFSKNTKNKDFCRRSGTCCVVLGQHTK